MNASNQPYDGLYLVGYEGQNCEASEPFESSDPPAPPVQFQFWPEFTEGALAQADVAIGEMNALVIRQQMLVDCVARQGRHLTESIDLLRTMIMTLEDMHLQRRDLLVSLPEAGAAAEQQPA